MIIAAHQPRFAREVVDPVVVLSGGSVTEDGPADQVLTSLKHPATARFLRLMSAYSTTKGPV